VPAVRAISDADYIPPAKDRVAKVLAARRARFAVLAARAFSHPMRKERA